MVNFFWRVPAATNRVSNDELHEDSFFSALLHSAGSWNGQKNSWSFTRQLKKTLIMRLENGKTLTTTIYESFPLNWLSRLDLIRQVWRELLVDYPWTQKMERIPLAVKLETVLTSHRAAGINPFFEGCCPSSKMTYGFKLIQLSHPLSQLRCLVPLWWKKNPNHFKGPGTRHYQAQAWATHKFFCCHKLDKQNGRKLPLHLIFEDLWTSCSSASKAWGDLPRP